MLASDHVSDSLSKHIKEFALRNAPDAGIGIIDGEGFRRFAGHGLEVLNAERSRRASSKRGLAVFELFPARK